jgi:glycosyltransferase involved in cell wall biosynthesis
LLGLVKKYRVNVLFILPEYYPHSGGGISTYYQHYIRAVRPLCGKVKVITGSGYLQGGEPTNIHGIDIEFLDPSLYKKHLFNFTKFDLLPEFKQNLAAAWAMWEQSNEGEDYDIIECTDFALGFIPWVIRHQKPVITRLHGSTGQIAVHEQAKKKTIIEDFIKQTELLLLPLSSALITHSTSNQKYWKEMFPGKIIDKISPIFEPVRIKPLGLAARDNTGLVTARIQVWKGPAILCEALSLMEEDIRPAIKWLGRDTSFDDTSSTAAYLSKRFPLVWDKSVTSQNAIPNGRVHAAQIIAKFGIIPSIWDMFNFSCAEFLGAGTPVICSDGAGAVELITNGVNGFTYPANDALALAECIKAISSLDETAYNKMANAAFETVITELSAERLTPAYIRKYEDVIANFNPVQPNEFLDTVYNASSVKDGLENILDKQPIKKIVAYLAKRMKTKIKLRG